ncbi:MAG: malate/lactate/ureidoglycolate dehydrogenase, partial [Rhodospirillaceae bacterium]|nr:malate/lactate/ureidoglycolate dehydrogenase [Rhodospirillaceae bacterium]
HDSHGIQMVKYYLDCQAQGGLDAHATPRVFDESGAVVRIDGGRGFGAVTGAFAMQHGIANARKNGVALVALANSHHLGRIGRWAELCLESGMVSVHFVNVWGHRPLVAPWGGRKIRLGTNPICAGMPATANHPAFVLDFATSRVAFGKVGVAFDKGEVLPEGVMMDRDGAMTRDPGAMVDNEDGGALIAMGEHKGSGLAVLCDLLAGVLTGNGVGTPERQDGDTTINGMLSFVIDPDALGGFAAMESEIEALYDWVRSSLTAEGHDAILLAGDPERIAREDRMAHGIPLAAAAWEGFIEAAMLQGVTREALEQAVSSS